MRESHSQSCGCLGGARSVRSSNDCNPLRGVMADEKPLNSTSPTSSGSDLPLGYGLQLPFDGSTEEQLAFLQQIYQQKQVELLAQFQRAQTNLAMQHLGYFQALQQAQQAQQQAAPSAQQVYQPQPGSAHGSDGNDESDSQQASPTSKEGSSGLRNRRSYSGSGQTISQLTRDRLKTMIATKKNRGRLDNNLAVAASQSTASPSWASPVQAVDSPVGTGWTGNIETPGGSQRQPSMASPASTCSVAVSSPHFEPYPIPSTVHAAHSSLPSDYQLRKVNSEPNLKMRIRAKLLSKGSSPVQTHQNSAFSFAQHRSLQRSDSDVPMETAFSSTASTAAAAIVSAGQPSETTQAGLFATGPHLMMPSPSLPNLATTGSVQMDVSAFLAQAAFSPFLSMPSLLKSNLLASPASILDSMLDPTAISEGVARQAVKFDTRTLSSPLPIGGYPSLLKQQLRDLVLRRKSLVREEPEDEAALEAQMMSRLSNGAVDDAHSNTANTPLKTGLVYDSAMSKHQCVCADNKNHVEHGGRVHSIWARLQERGLVDNCERVVARKAPLEMLRTVHSPTYVTFFAISPTACLKMEPSQLPVKSFVQLPCGGIGVDSDTYFNDACTQLAARIAVGSLAELASQVAEGKLRNGFACIRPPGHHAENDQAMGFCFFNNVAITVKYLQQRYREVCARIAIIDWDVHHGNGTQLCFESDPSVLYLSLHRHDNGNFFPGTGAVTEVGTGAGKGYTVNVPFSGEMMADADYLAAWRVVVAPVLDQFQPTFIMVSAGFDAAKGHSQALGGFALPVLSF
uniref:histone deacetylase n=1 Tax=Parascaris univalens TaxID=6257 RepID=A0A914ZFZ8_PARUN